LIGYLGLRLYRTSNDNSVLYDHDLESYALFDKDGNQVPKDTVDKVGETFERILEEVQSELIHMYCAFGASFRSIFSSLSAVLHYRR